MISLLFFLNILFILVFWWKIFCSQYWDSKLAVQLLLFIAPTLLGLIITALALTWLPLEFIRVNRSYLYIYSSIYLIMLIPQWYKLAWKQVTRYRKVITREEYSLIFTIAFAVMMIFAMVMLFAMYYLWFFSVGAGSQGLLSAQHYYQPLNVDLPTAIYFSFVSYFTLGYGDLVPYGLWMQSFVFFECIASVINTGIIIIYVFNFLLKNTDKRYYKDHN